MCGPLGRSVPRAPCTASYPGARLRQHLLLLLLLSGRGGAYATGTAPLGRAERTATACRLVQPASRHDQPALARGLLAAPATSSRLAPGRPSCSAAARQPAAAARRAPRRPPRAGRSRPCHQPAGWRRSSEGLRSAGGAVRGCAGGAVGGCGRRTPQAQRRLAASSTEQRQPAAGSGQRPAASGQQQRRRPASRSGCRAARSAAKPSRSCRTRRPFFSACVPALSATAC
jgi:hypothetical protein